MANQKNIWHYLTAGFFIFVLIRISQFWLYATTPINGATWCHGFLGLRTYYNSGIAFGLPLPNLLLIIFNLLIIIGLVIYWQKFIQTAETTKAWSITLILAGAFSNLIERIRSGHVLDFFQVWWLPVFNLADIFIIIGAIWLIIVCRSKK